MSPAYKQPDNPTYLIGLRYLNVMVGDRRMQERDHGFFSIV